jgi:hypothetical protein
MLSAAPVWAIRSASSSAAGQAELKITPAGRAEGGGLLHAGRPPDLLRQVRRQALPVAFETRMPTRSVSPVL